MSRTPAECLQIALGTLGDQEMPEGYINVVRDFLRTNPYDDRWIIELGYTTDPQTYGVITCMEEGCYTDVILGADRAVLDGGRSIGVGSLDEYRRHVVQHPTHRNARDERQADRIAADRAKSGLGVKREESPNAEVNGSESPVKRARSSAPGSGSVTPMDGVHRLAQPAQMGPVAGPSRLAAVAGAGGDVLSNEQKRALVREEYEYLSHMLRTSKHKAVRIKVAERIKELVPEINRPGLVREPAARRWDLLSYLPELQTQFGSFAEPPAHYRVAGGPVPAPAPPVAAVAGPSQPQSGMDRFKYQLDRIAAAAAGRAVVHNALAGPSNQLAPNYVPLANGMPGGYGALRDDLGDDSDEDGLGFDFAPRTGNKVIQNGRQMEMTEFFEDSLNDFADSAKVTDALKVLDLKDVKDIVPGLKITLMPHQIIGVSWMVEQEAKPKYCGGMLADAMGLGKTVQTLALMVINQSAEVKKKCNLIVAPIALLSQWKDEIETKSVDLEDPETPALSVYIYHGPKKTKSKRELKGYDVILTSYGTLVAEFPKPKKNKGKKKVNSDGELESDDAVVHVKDVYGPLVQIEWFRIILDEAQQIRNKNTRVSKCIAELESDYRWCLTGTPITNTVDDLYGIFRFLQTPQYSDWDHFRDYISKPAKRNADMAAKRAQTVLRATMLRRNKESQIDGKPLLNLGPKDIVLEKLEFTAEERELYTQVETRAQVRFNKFLKAGTVLKNYANVLTMLLRLRQLANHPQLLARAKGEPISPNDLMLEGGQIVEHEDVAEPTKATELARVIALKGQDFVDQVKAKFKARDDAAALAENNDADAEADGDRECPICMEPLTDSVITGCCMQEYCEGCIEELKPAERENEVFDPDDKSCPTCRGKLTKDTLFKSLAFEEDVVVKDEPETGSTIIPGAKIEDLDEEDDLPEASMIGKGKGRKNKMAIYDSDEEEFKPDIKGKGKARAVYSDSSDTDDDEDEIMDPDDIHNINNSTKLQRMLDLVDLWAEESPDDKVIIFSQWVKFIDLIQVVLNRAGHRFLRYEGSMTRLKREETVRKFMTQEKCRILVISLKCGGVGLNLTRANRIINMDLAWNMATEDQALDRVHRIGQMKPVEVHRLVIDGTVEQRILELQEKKKKMADASLGEGSGQKMGRLSVRDLANLFNVPA